MQVPASQGQGHVALVKPRHPGAPSTTSNEPTPLAHLWHGAGAVGGAFPGRQLLHGARRVAHDVRRVALALGQPARGGERGRGRRFGGAVRFGDTACRVPSATGKGSGRTARVAGAP